MKEKIQKRESLVNKKTMRNQTIQQKSHQSCPSRKILGTILEVDERRTLTNGQDNEKTHDDALGLTSQRRRRQTVCVKKRRRKWSASIEDSVDASIQRQEDYIKTRGGRLITATRTKYRQRKHRQNKKSRKQKWEEKQL